MESKARGRCVYTAEMLAGGLITYLCALIGFLGGVRDSPEERAAKRGAFTGCQFGGNDTAL